MATRSSQKATVRCAQQPDELETGRERELTEWQGRATVERCSASRLNGREGMTRAVKKDWILGSCRRIEGADTHLFGSQRERVDPVDSPAS